MSRLIVIASVSCLNTTDNIQSAAESRHKHNKPNITRCDIKPSAVTVARSLDGRFVLLFTDEINNCPSSDAFQVENMHYKYVPSLSLSAALQQETAYAI